MSTDQSEAEMRRQLGIKNQEIRRHLPHRPLPGTLREIFESPAESEYEADFLSQEGMTGTVHNIVRWLCKPPGAPSDNQYLPLPGPAWGGIWVTCRVEERCAERAVVEL